MITVFEHECVRVGSGENSLSPDQLLALQKYYGNGSPFFSLIHNGVRFNAHVGVLQVGNTLIEVLPKADDSPDEARWREILIDMMRAVSGFEIKSTGNANLEIKHNTILDLYFELFVKETEYLLHTGLVKRYRQTEGNNAALKGNLIFSKHIQHNVVHQERFYTRYTTYDRDHLLNQLLLKTINILKHINTNPALGGRIGALLLAFPELPDVKVTASTFEKISFNRKTQAYQTAIRIARMILLHYHPDLTSGRNDVLALMFDMNLLWQEFVLITLRKQKDFTVQGQHYSYFWKPANGNRRKLIPDIVVKYNDQQYVLDTKWKNISNNPSVEDLRQMYAYHHYFLARKVALFYPGADACVSGRFMKTGDHQAESDIECSMLFTEPADTIKMWQDNIQQKILNWILC